MHLPGGRYACARVLVSRGLPFLAGCSLGQVCHIVQLAISQKRILGYLEGQLVPYWHSEEWVKEQYAFHQQPICSRKGTNSLPLATWEEARERLLQLLDSESNPEPGVVTLSNVKRLFRSRFQLELSETVLGHSRLFDLLHDIRFRDVCTVQAHGNGQLLVKRAEGPRHIPCHQLGLTQGQEPYYQEAWTGTSCPQQQGGGAPGSQAAPPGVWNHVFMGSVLYPQASNMSALPPNLSMLREAEIDLGMEHTWQGLSPGASPRDSPTHSSCGASPWANNSHQEMADFCMKFHEEDSGVSTDTTPYFRDAPFLSGWSSDEAEPAVTPLALQAEEIRAEEEATAAAMCRNLRETLQHWGTDVDAPGEVKSSAIKNTFIDFRTAKHTGSKKRLSSVPKDLFSKKSVLETTCHALLSPSPKHRPSH